MLLYDYLFGSMHMHSCVCTHAYDYIYIYMCVCMCLLLQIFCYNFILVLFYIKAQSFLLGRHFCLFCCLFSLSTTFLDQKMFLFQGRSSTCTAYIVHPYFIYDLNDSNHKWSMHSYVYDPRPTLSNKYIFKIF